MSDYKEFQGKSLDEAIQEACSYFDMKRDKLEVEIVAGGSTGIFGLVGAKPAVVKARPRNTGGTVDERPRSSTPAQSAADEAPQRESAPAASTAESQPPAKRTEAQPPAQKPAAQPPAERQESQPPAKQEKAPRQQRGRERAPKREAKPKQQREQTPRQEPRGKRDNDNRGNRDHNASPNRDNNAPDGNRIPQVDPFADINKDELELTVREVTITLIEQLVMAPKLDVKVGKDRVNVLIDEPEHSGLIIGREGQTLSSLQYLVNRIVSRRMDTSVRVQIDTGDYRERQDDKLRETANHLAEKARRSGRTQSTKPLSSYHRRIVHLTLQDDERVFTRSKGEGPMKRVLVVPKKRPNGGREGQRDEANEPNGNR